MAVGRISGPLLKDNLLRNGIDLAFETDLLYLDVNNQRIGIKTAAPTHELQVNGTTRTTSLIVDSATTLGEIEIAGNTISTQNQYLNLGTFDTVVYQNKLRVDSIDIENNTISTNNTDSSALVNLELRPTGTVEVAGNMNVDGNIHATGDITADGNITLGDADTDSVVFNAEIASNIIPDQSGVFDLGSNPATGGKEWHDIWVNTLVAASVSSQNLTVDGIDLTLRAGNIYYVAMQGLDTNTGDHPQAPFGSLKYALENPALQAGDTIHIFPGEYQEEFPLTVPAGVNIRGEGIRAVKIVPTPATAYNDAFLLNGDTTVEDITVADFYGATENTITLENVLNNPSAYSTSNGDYFGYSVDTDGVHTIVGAYIEGDAGGTISGKAYIFDVATGTLVHTLDNPNAYSTSASDYFGASVAISGNRAIVGANGEDDAGGTQSGKAYIFDVTTGQLIRTLDNPNPYSTSAGDYFGAKVAISGNYAVVGAHLEDGAGGVNSGKAYIFDLSKEVTSIAISNVEVRGDLSTPATEYIDLKLSTDSTYDRYTGGGDDTVYRPANGNGVWLGSQPTTVSSFSINYGIGTGVNALSIGMPNDYWWQVRLTMDVTYSDASTGTQTFEFGATSRDPGTVTFVPLSLALDNPNAYGTIDGDYFGYSVAIDGNYAIVGAYLEDDAGNNNSGKAYIFNVTTGALLHTLDNPNAYDVSTYDYFGYSVAISGNYAVVGAYAEDNAGGVGSGKAYIYNVSTGSLIHTLDDPNAYSTSAGDQFGISVAISGTTVVVGAYQEDDAGGTSSGKAYVFSALSGQLLHTLDNPNAYSTSASDFFGFSVAIGGTTAVVGAYGEDDAGGSNSGKAYTYNLSGTTESGYAFRFAPGASITARSPYLRNVTVLTHGSATSSVDPLGFDAGNAGKGALVDGGVLDPSSKEAAMLFHAATFVTPGVDAITATNGARIEWLNSFTYFANRSIYAYDSVSGKYGDGKTRIRLGDVTGTFAAGDTVTFTSTDASTVYTKVIEGTETASVADSIILLIDGKDTDLIGFDSTPDSITSTSGGSALTLENVDVRSFGAEVRLIGSASVYGNYGLVGDGDGVLMYAIGHNMAYIGTGKEQQNDPLAVIQANEVVETNGARIRYNSVDHQGDFRVGNLFYVDQQTGTANFNVGNFSINTTNGLTISSGGDTTYIDGSRIDTGNLRISGNTIESLSGDVNIDAASDVLNISDNVSISGNLDVAGNITVGGNITIGDEASDTIQIVAGISSNLIPSTNILYDLGSASNNWRNLYINEMVIDEVTITDNYITTNTTNTDLELRANGTGQIVIPNNDVEFTNSVTVLGNASLRDVSVTGTVIHNGDYVQTGNYEISGAIDNGNIQIAGNLIQTTESNSDLELRASGTGVVSVPTNDVTLGQDLTVVNNTNLHDTTLLGTFIHTGDSLQTGNYTIAGTFSNGNIQIAGNLIQTTESNSDLELRASGTGVVSVPTNDVTLGQDLAVNGNSTLHDTSLLGTLTHVGNTVQTGNYTIDGYYTSGDIVIDDNYITTTESNSNLELRASGTGKVLVPNNDLEVTNNITVSGDTDLQDTTVTGTVTHTGDYNQTGNFNISGDISNGSILINDNYIEVTAANTNLEFTANGTGVVSIPNNDAVINTNLTVLGDTELQSTSITGTLTHIGDALQTGNYTIAGTISNGNIQIAGNVIETTETNSDFELRAHGTGEVIVPLNDVVISQDLTVNGNSTFENTYINGSLTVNGNTVQTGDLQIDGTVYVSQALDVGAAAQFEEILIDDNFITTTSSNANLELRAAGTGNIVVPYNDVLLAQNLEVVGDGTFENIVVTNTTTSDTFTNGDIVISNNVVETTLSNSDLELRSSGTGIVSVPSNNVVLGQNLTVNGDTNLKNVDITGTVTHVGNYYQTGNITLTGNYIVSGAVDFTGATQFEEILIDDNFITTTTSNSDLELRANGTGKVLIPNNDVEFSNAVTIGGTTTTQNITSSGTVFATTQFETGDIVISGDTISTTLSNSNLNLSANGTGIINLNATTTNVNGNLTVTGDTTLADTTITGTITHTGNVTHTGNYTISGVTTITNDLTVSGNAAFSEIDIIGNEIRGTTTNTDLVVTANGTGIISIPSNDVVINNDLLVNGSFSVNSLVISTRLNAPEFSNGDIEIVNNDIQTTLSNSDLELRANGTGKVLIPTSNFEITNDLTVVGDTTLANVNITGSVVHTGNTTQTGNYTISNALTVSANATISGVTQFEDIRISGNVIETTESNSNLELRPAGTGSVIINASADINGDATVTGTLYANQINNLGTITANRYTTGDIIIDDNYITTTLSNSDLELRANGTGSVIIDDLAIDQATITSTSDITLTPSAGSVIIDSTGSLVLPVGDTSQRPGTPVQGDIRFNSQTETYEGFNGTTWVSLQGIQDSDGNTRITAELTAGANDDTIRFYAGGSLIADLDVNRLNVPKVVVDDITIDNNTIQTTTVDTDLILSGNGTGAVRLENLAFSGTTITALTNTRLVFDNPNGGYVKFNGTGGLVIPSGDTNARPSTPESGMTRYNTSDKRVEIYNGTAWVSVAGTSSSITYLDAENIALEYVLVLG